MDPSERNDPQSAPDPAGADPSLVEPVRHALDFARAWSNLLASEAALAKANAALLVAGAFVVLALAFTTFVALDAVLAAIVFDLVRNWIIATSVALVADVALLVALLLLLRGWWRSLSLPQSRAALKQLWRSPDEREKDRQGADARSAA